MTADEKELLLSYICSEGYRRDSELVSAKDAYFRKRNEIALLRLLRAHIAQATYNKIIHDITALLNI